MYRATIIIVLALICLQMNACEKSKTTDDNTSCVEDSDCNDGYRCYKGDCRLSCHDRECPVQLSVCNEEEFCISDENVIDGDGKDIVVPDGDKDLELDQDTCTDRDLDEIPVSDGDVDEEKELDSFDRDIEIEKDKTENTDVDKTENQELEHFENDTEKETGDVEVSELDTVDKDTNEIVEDEADKEEDTDQCECTEGKCCDGCNFKVEGIVCDYEYGQIKQCFPNGEGQCNQLLRWAVSDRLCSGISAECDGAEVGTMHGLGVIDDCTDSEYCTLDGCVEDFEYCCECYDGACCWGCQIEEEGEPCELIYSEVGCPYGTEMGTDVYHRSEIRTCSGVSTECDGEINVKDWTIWRDCEENERCDDSGICIKMTCEEENGIWGCTIDEPYYCRNHICVEKREACNVIPLYHCSSPDDFCNDLYFDCLPKAGPCEMDDDCQRHPAGEYCDLTIQMCRGEDEHCLPEINNCYAGTECNDLNEILGYQGAYCTGCEEDSDCYPGLKCHKRTLLPDVCTPV